MKPLFTLPWPAPLHEGRLLARDGRFTVSVVLGSNGRTVSARCANSGAMEGLVRRNNRVWLMPLSSPTSVAAQPEWRWALTECDGALVGVDPAMANCLVHAMLEARALPHFTNHIAIARDFPHAPGSRVDFRLRFTKSVHDLDVLNCHLVYPDRRGYFPEAVSTRETRHLEVLSRECRRGLAATVLFVIQREDVKSLRPSDLHDPDFAKAMRRARDSGVKFSALRTRPTLHGLNVLGSVSVDLKPYDTRRHAIWRQDLAPYSGWANRPRTVRAVPPPTDSSKKISS